MICISDGLDDIQLSHAKFMGSIAEITLLYHRYFSFKLSYPVIGPHLQQYLFLSRYIHNNYGLITFFFFC